MFLPCSGGRRRDQSRASLCGTAPALSAADKQSLYVQDVRRIETKGPAVDDLIHTAVVEPADEEEGLAVEEVRYGAA